MRKHELSSVIVALTLLWPGASFVNAQTAAPPASGGPLIVEHVEKDFVLAPEFKAASFDGRAASLAGGYAGVLTDRTLLVGVGGYWLTNRADDFKMGYGGLVLGWTMPVGSKVRFGAKGLVGVGTATLGADVRVQSPMLRFGSPQRPGLPLPMRRFVFSDHFLIAEPEFDVRLKLSRRLGLDVGAGYRFAGSTGALDDRVNGAIGSVALQIGGW